MRTERGAGPAKLERRGGDLSSIPRPLRDQLTPHSSALLATPLPFLIMRNNVDSSVRSLSGLSTRAIVGLTALSATLLIGGCSGSGASSTADAVGTANGAFQLSSINVDPGQSWQINRAVEFIFSAPVDFDTVNLNTISIQETSGAPAVGDFTPGDNARTVIFQPVCPTRDDFSDAGFRPGGVTYQIHVPTSATGATTVHSATNKPLSASFPSNFLTPTSTNDLALLFLDPVPGAVQAVTLTSSSSAGSVGTSIRFGDEDTGTDISFVTNDTTGVGELPAATLVPINYYSDVDTQVVVDLRLNQAVNPKAENISSERIKLQYQTLTVPTEWKDLTTVLDLKGNCAGTGAWIEIRPIGVLPQNRAMRVVIGQEFEDLIGELNPGDQTNFATMFTSQAQDAGMTAIPTGDTFSEEYVDETYEDTVTSLSYPRANWGSDDLAAAFAFDGTGGPNGEFDVHIDTDMVFNTVSQTFTGGPGGFNTGTILATNGRLDIRDLVVEEGATLRITGGNTARILCSGDVVVNGTIRVSGGNAKSVFSLNAPNQVETGAPGQAGGGAGGDGSFLTTQVTPLGGNGKGAYNIANGGGFGGESGWSTSTNDTLRRAAGGGGGRLGHRQMLAYTNTSGDPYTCPDFDRTGLDYESGFPGAEAANSSQDGGTHLPYGGRIGPSPFNSTAVLYDDFWGTKVQNFGDSNQQLVVGEMTGVRPGAGGGAGGDATRVLTSESYPPEELSYPRQDKGAGGGGGAGAITILALGNVTFGEFGTIQAKGGHGNGGENTGGVNRIGGGSGGGSGGHIVIQTAGKIDFSAVKVNATTGAPLAGYPCLDAKGGQGGEGAAGACPENNGCGGAFTGETPVNQDAVHATDPGSLPTSGNGLIKTDNPWLVNSDDDEFISTNCKINLGLPPSAITNHYSTVGGDGGPGLIQLHVGRLYDEGAETSDFIYPTTGIGTEQDLRFISSPVPHGYDVNDRVWNDHLLPIFGRFSAAQSTWIPLGEASVDPASDTPQPVTFLFDGTDGAGFVESTAGVVDALPAILTEGAVAFDVSVPSIPKVLISDASLDASYSTARANPGLFNDFLLKVNGVPQLRVASASYDEGTSTFSIEVIDPPLDFSAATGMVELFPRQFAVRTSGVENSLPTGQAVKVEFDLMYQEDGETTFETTGFVDDIEAAATTINMGSNTIRFVRYRMTFDLGSGDIGFTTPLPTMDFLKVPFRF